MNYQLPVIQNLRAIKTKQEIFYITRAQIISEQVLVELINKLKVGVSEIYLARFIATRFKQLGVKALAFEPIVAFSRGTADIHHVPSTYKLKVGDTVMFDFGATVNGYCSDMTRTYFFGLPSARQKKVYSAVLEAQNKALKLLAHGEKRTSVIDASAREFLNKKFGPKKFPHGLGHGVGTVIHEWPSFKPKSEDLLKPNMVMTVEPGLYFKGWGGVRIEDMIVVRGRGCRNLTKVPKMLSDIILPV